MGQSHIRVLTPDDFSQIKVLHEANLSLLDDESVKEFTENLPLGNLVGCFDEDKLIGYSGSEYNCSWHEFNTLSTVVDSDYWHLGIGTSLVAEVLKRVPTDYSLYYEAWTIPPNKPNAHRLLKELDFELVRVISNEEYATGRECSKCVRRDVIDCECEIHLYKRSGLGNKCS